MNKYDERAAAIQAANKKSESEHEDVYEEDTVRRSIVYIREDMTMVASYLSSLNEQMLSVRRLHWSILGLLVILIFQRL